MSHVIVAVQKNRNVLFDVVRDYIAPYAMADTSDLEREVFWSIINQVYGKQQFAMAGASRQRTYRNYLTTIEREAMRQEQYYMTESVLRGDDMLVEIARMLSIKFQGAYTRFDVVDILKSASLVCADIDINIEGAEGIRQVSASLGYAVA